MPFPNLCHFTNIADRPVFVNNLDLRPAPFRVFLQLLTFEEARAALASAEYPLFVQLCRPPLLFNAEPEYPVVKLLSTLALTNRNLEKVDGEFR